MKYPQWQTDPTWQPDSHRIGVTLTISFAFMCSTQFRSFSCLFYVLHWIRQSSTEGETNVGLGNAKKVIEMKQLYIKKQIENYLFVYIVYLSWLTLSLNYENLYVCLTNYRSTAQCQLNMNIADRRRRYRPHKVYIILISINSRVDITMFDYSFIRLSVHMKT